MRHRGRCAAAAHHPGGPRSARDTGRWLPGKDSDAPAVGRHWRSRELRSPAAKRDYPAALDDCCYRLMLDAAARSTPLADANVQTRLALATRTALTQPLLRSSVA